MSETFMVMLYVWWNIYVCFKLTTIYELYLVLRSIEKLGRFDILSIGW